MAIMVSPVRGKDGAHRNNTCRAHNLKREDFRLKNTAFPTIAVGDFVARLLCFCRSVFLQNPRHPFSGFAYNSVFLENYKRNGKSEVP